MITLLLIALMWGLYLVASLSGAGPATDFGVAMPLRANDWHILSASWTSESLSGLIFATIAASALAYPAERVLGWRRFVGTLALMVFVVTPAALIAARGIEETGLNRWGTDLISGVFVSPLGWVFGTSAVAAGHMGQLWRRRVTAVLLVLSATLVLFGGSLAEVVALSCTLVGVGVAAIGRRTPGLPVSLRERRLLVTLMLAAVAVGPIISGTTTLGMSPLTAVGTLTWWPDISLRLAEGGCRGSEVAAQCQLALDIATHGGFGQAIGNFTPFFVQLAIFAGLIRGRRGAWWWAVAFQVATVIGLTMEVVVGVAYDDFTFLYSVNLIEILLPWLASLLLLLLSRRLFDVRVDRRGTSGFVLSAGTGLGISAGLWWVVFGGEWLQWFSRLLPPVLATVLPEVVVPIHRSQWLAYDWVGPLFWLIFSAALARFLLRTPDERSAADRRRAQEILRRGTGDHLQQMTVWEGNHYWFANAPESGEAYVAYRLYRGIVVTVGEPVLGPGANAAAVAAEFESYVTQQGWQVAWYSVRAEFADRGYKKVHVAEESILSTEDVEFKGKRFQNIRTARNRAVKEGVRVEWTTWAALGLSGHEKIYALSEEWVGEKSLPEMGFTLGTVSELADPDTLLGLAIDEAGHLHGVTSWLPVRDNGQVRGLILDFMRRDAQGFRPVIELLLAEAVVHAAELGYEWVSLSGAPLAKSEPQEGTLLDATLDRVGAAMEPLYGFRSLAASKNKFHPHHEGWYLAYPDELALPAIGLAVAHAYLPHMKVADAYRAFRQLREARSAE